MTQDPIWWSKETKPMFNTGSSYLPFSELPKEEIKFKALYVRVEQLIKSHTPFGGENAFKCVLSELTDNIYQHSEFKRSFMMCQAYKSKKYVELSFIDDGVSIPGNFELHNINFEGDWNAIAMAVNGQSTKDNYERGTVLSSSLRIYCEGAKAEAMIVSRNGVYYKKPEKTQLYSLKNQQGFQGTLISIRIPMKTDNIEIYKYLTL
ncbi:MAG: ATP-binding protein [Thermoplasmataceae archaeon]